MGAGAGAHPWGGVSPLQMRYAMVHKHQSIIGRPPLGEILYPPLEMRMTASRQPVNHRERYMLNECYCRDHGLPLYFNTDGCRQT